MSENILILGAGISGLMAAKMLKQAGYSVIILEKSRGVGGRMATRRFKDGKFDHGAQYFTVRDPQFAAWVEKWQREDIVREWTREIHVAGRSTAGSGHPRYIGVDGMTAVAKHLSKDLDIHLNTRIKSTTNQGGVWTAKSEADEEFFGQHLILTAPVPQSLSLLHSGEITMPQNVLNRLQNMLYDPCIAVMALLEGSSGMPTPGGIKFESGPIQWMADNSQKGISPQQTAVTIHAAVEFSKENYDLDKERLAELLLEAAKPWLATTIMDWQVHKWRYSQPKHLAEKLFIKIGEQHCLYFSGDAFGGGRVEGAALSGLAVGNDLKRELSG